MLLGYQPQFHVRAFIAARRMKCPLLLRAETTDYNHSRSRLKQLIRDNVLRLFYKQFARLLYIGERSRAHYRRLGCNELQLIFSPYCVDTTPFRLDESERVQLRTATRDVLGISPSKRVLLFSGKLAQHKAPDLLIEALKTMPDDVRQQIVTIFLGDGELRTDWSREQPIPLG